MSRAVALPDVRSLYRALIATREDEDYVYNLYPQLVDGLARQTLDAQSIFYILQAAFDTFAQQTGKPQEVLVTVWATLVPMLIDAIIPEEHTDVRAELHQLHQDTIQH